VLLQRAGVIVARPRVGFASVSHRGNRSSQGDTREFPTSHIAPGMEAAVCPRISETRSLYACEEYLS
jgi:hypothetical protein